MPVITAESVAEGVYGLIPSLGCCLPVDIASALDAAEASEEHPLGREALSQLGKNHRIASQKRVPICQDTGTVWVCLEAGPDVLIPGDVFSLVDDAVGRAYEESCFRMSVVKNALFDRQNTKTNAPAFTDIHLVDEPGCRLHVMLKGGGSDNASRVVMLTPGAGRQGIVDEVMRCVREKASCACPPLVVGIGIGSTFDKVAGLAKSALLRPVGTSAADELTASFECDLLEQINASGIGAGGLGGSATAIAVHVNTAPCHIAALPLAINMGCSALRRATVSFDVATGRFVLAESGGER